MIFLCLDKGTASTTAAHGHLVCVLCTELRKGLNVHKLFASTPAVVVKQELKGERLVLREDRVVSRGDMIVAKQELKGERLVLREDRVVSRGHIVVANRGLKPEAFIKITNCSLFLLFAFVYTDLNYVQVIVNKTLYIFFVLFFVLF